MEAGYCVFNKSSQSFLALNVRCASTVAAQFSTLFGKHGLGSGEGLWIVPGRSVHTVGMLFPIDLIYLDERQRVIDLVEHLRPFRIAPLHLRSASVLEVPSYTIFSSRTRVGDQLAICTPEELALFTGEHAQQPALVSGA